MKEFKLPELGENIASADVLNVLVKTGDVVKTEQIILEIETDKATIEVPSSVSGIVTDVFVKNGEKVKVGEVLFKVNDDEISSSLLDEKLKDDRLQIENQDSPIKNESNILKSKNSTFEAFDFKLPELGENIQTAQIIKVLVISGDTIKIDQTILEIETDKATIEVPSNVNGKVIAVFVKEGEKAHVGQPIFRIEAEEILITNQNKILEKEIIVGEKKSDENLKMETAKKNDNQEKKSIESVPPILENPAPASPSVRRLARELGIDINKVPASSVHGRISMDDVKAFVKKLNEQKAFSLPENIVSIKSELLPDFSKFGSVERKPLSNIRSKVTEHLSYAWASIPHVTQFDVADITELENIRKSFSKQIEKLGTKLTVTSILVKIVAEALKVFEQFNSSIDVVKKELIFKKYFNIGVAVDTENGLIVPVIKNVNSKNLTEISLEINFLAEKARNRKISLDELQGGCFTISNLGGIGGTYFTPIINSPEAAILGISKSQIRPKYKDGQLVPRLIMPLSLSYDHRIIDGADGIRFLRWIIEAVENPLKLFL